MQARFAITDCLLLLSKIANELTYRNMWMPQVWVTYKELATLFGCDEPDARKLANKQKLDQSRGRDGELRVKLSSIGLAMFTEKLRRPDEMLDLAIKQQYARLDYSEVHSANWRAYYPWI